VKSLSEQDVDLTVSMYNPIMLNFDTGEMNTDVTVIMAKIKGKKKTLTVNYCPFCGESILPERYKKTGGDNG
jgi:hypothetical protein